MGSPTRPVVAIMGGPGLGQDRRHRQPDQKRMDKVVIGGG
jgi:hypothetical protein